MTIGSKLFRIKECANSLAWAKEHIFDAPDGSIFIADTLTQASGRSGRIWVTYPGQLLITILLKPEQIPDCSIDDLPVRLNQLNMALALGIATPMKKYNVGIKWPNDFIANNKKIGGMLTHIIWQNNWPLGIILGFGINVNNIFEPTDPLFDQATSLHAILGHKIDMRTLYKEILASLDEEYSIWKQKQFNAIYKNWKSQQLFMGQKLTVHHKDGSLVTGTMTQVLPNGDIMLATPEKKIITLPFCLIHDVKIG